VDKTDIEILTTLRNSTPIDLNGIKMCGMNMPDSFELKHRLFQLLDQDFIKLTEDKLYRITHNGKNLFWKANDEENNIMRLLKISLLTDIELKRITGLPEERYDEVILQLILMDLVYGEQKTDQGFPYKLSPQGHERMKLISEQPTDKLQKMKKDIGEIKDNTSNSKRNMIITGGISFLAGILSTLVIQYLNNFNGS